jgi:hypothetical protein
MYHVREVRESDLPFLADHLRAADVIELAASSGSVDTLKSIRVGVDASVVCKVGCAGDEPVVIWGMSKQFGSAALIWAVATPSINTHRMEFIRGSRPHVAELFDTAPEVNSLINFTHANNHVHHRWLSWCGARLLPPVPFGPLGASFHPFTIQREYYKCATPV